MPFYQSDDYPQDVRVDDDLRYLRRDVHALEIRVTEDEQNFDRLYESMGWLLKSVGEILAWWKNEEDKASR